MNVDQVVVLGRMMLQEVMILAGPNPGRRDLRQPGGEHRSGAHFAAGHYRFHGFAPASDRAALFFLMPWMWRHLAHYTLLTLSDFRWVPAMIESPCLTIISGLLTIGVRLSGLMLFAPFFGSAGDSDRVSRRSWCWR